NYLLPRKIAVEATPSCQRQFEAQKDAHIRKEQAAKEKAEALRAGLEGVILNFARKAGEDERLFGSVTAHDIEDALKKRGFQSVEKKDILLHEPIKRIGLHAVDVRLHHEVMANLKLDVVKEQ
ncbi:MAG: 50S ribosomal protein L9, partial [Deltaproteobacteria bacterium]|nr:50S ribosomal protein L9 [Deltaproteobacteria bacterium]